LRRSTPLSKLSRFYVVAMQTIFDRLVDNTNILQIGNVFYNGEAIVL
jgi:hypothetical protein